MLRIMIYERPQETSFLVEGRLVGLRVKALEKMAEVARGYYDPTHYRR